jgi:hypothetical protein
MSCCGKMRQQLAGAVSPPRTEPAAAEARPGVQYAVVFEYTGRTGLTVIGAASGRRYRFDGPGARVVVNPRDRPSLARVPKLRQVT